jgi:hypothetical protein
MKGDERYDINVAALAGHTPGPWTDEYSLIVTADEKHVIASGVEWDEGGARGIDAPLIAAAPDLLAAYQFQARRIKELEAENKQLERALGIANSRAALKGETNEPG